ncbi:MAG: dicarboxylate/amino acid:cation symporter [Acidobacteria bacterium]|nr:MAG: dicarboxylate/amino acid:cation symporter [Acidobacteriota bacterium]
MSHSRILLGLVAGAAAGVAANVIWGGADRRVEWIVYQITEPLGELFLRLLLMTVVPLVFSSLVVGISGVGDIRRLGRIGLKCFVYTVVISAISVVIGISLANLVRPGQRIEPATARALVERYGADAGRRVQAAAQTQPQPSALTQVVRTLVPANPIAAVASDTPNMLHLMFFAVVLAIAITLLPASATEPLIRAFDALFQVSAKIIDMVMWVAPFAVACLLFTTTARFGFELIVALAWFVATVLAGLALHMFGVYSLSVAVLSRIPPVEFFRRIRTVMLTAFSTSSSNATLPTALRVSEENLGVPREINSFVLTIGATANQNGTALYEGVTVLFLAQLAGVHLTLGQQVLVAYLAILGGVGTAGVPSGSIPFIIVVLTTIGVNPSLIALILGVDRILDMCRTTLNVTGDITAATYVARSEGYTLLKPEPATMNLD